ncbi:hypothetical protein [Saccharibacillus sacchari]|uniref:Uncharacterized protein n=1 Tax=Saccharibacillus sacchari TaxID=456493 RepID=A0ACC6PI76_9BACL
MTFQNPGVWKQRAQNENMQGIDSDTQRSGVVYNNTNNIWLIMTPTQCTAEQFRTAILGSIGFGTLVNGIFLDSGGSSQMRAGTTTIAASSRKVPEMLALRS